MIVIKIDDVNNSNKELKRLTNIVIIIINIVRDRNLKFADALSSLSNN